MGVTPEIYSQGFSCPANEKDPESAGKGGEMPGHCLVSLQPAASAYRIPDGIAEIWLGDAALRLALLGRQDEAGGGRFHAHTKISSSSSEVAKNMASTARGRSPTTAGTSWMFSEKKK